MKCTEFRDLSELLRDGALGAAEAEAARAHFAGCPDCRSFEGDCAVLVAPFRGLPPGPYLPPVPPGGLPPWANGSLLGCLLALVLVGGVTAWALRDAGRPLAIETGRAEATRPGTPETGPDPVQAEPPAPSILVAEGGASLIGRVVTFPGGKPVGGAAVLIDGVPLATTDAAGVFVVRDLAAAGSRLLRLEPAGGTPSELLLPYMGPGQAHSLADILVGKPGSATVRVVRWDGLPGAGVRVRACRLVGTDFPHANTDWEPGSQGPVLPAQESVPTDAEGSAEFPALAPGTWTFQAEMDGVPFSRPATLEVRDDPDLATTLFLDPATALEGRVLEDADDRPVAGARVRWTRMGLNEMSDDFRVSGTTTTDAEGRFRFPRAPAIPLHLQVRRPGVACRSGGTCVDASRLDRVDIRLPRAGTFFGVCIEAGTGLPAPGVIVHASINFREGASSSSVSVYSRSGPDGRFEVRGIPESAFLQARPLRHTDWFPPGPQGINYLTVGTPCRIDVVRTGSVHGLVRNDGGLPAAGRFVLALGLHHHFGDIDDEKSMTRVGLTVSDAEGRFVLDDLPPGPVALLSPEREDIHSLALLGEGRKALQSTPPPSCVVTIPLPAGFSATVQAGRPLPSTTIAGRSTVTRSIRGRVVDSGGLPVTGVSLLLQSGDRSPALQGRGSSFFLWLPMGSPVPVLADGTFCAEVPLENSPSASRTEEYTLLATSLRHPPSFAVARFEGKDLVEGVVLPFEDGFSISGRVLHADGTPAAGVPLEAMPQEDARPNGNSIMVRARTAEDGSFRVEGLFRGLHTLTVGRDPGPVHLAAGLLSGGDPVVVRLPPGDGVRAKPPILHRPWKAATDAQRTSSIGGRILGPKGVPMYPASVDIFQPLAPGIPVFSSWVDETGQFRCPVPPMRRFSVAADLKEGRWLFVDDVPAGAKDTVLLLDGPSTGLLRGRVVTPSGTPGGRVPVHAVRVRGKGEPGLPPDVLLEGRQWGHAGETGPLVPRFVRTTLTADDGSFDLGSPPGNWTVFAGIPGSTESASGAAVPWSAADPKHLEVPLSPGRVIRVRSVDDDAPPDAQPPSWAEIHLDGFLPGADGPVLAVRHGLRPGSPFEFRGLPQGRFTALLLDARRKEVGRASVESRDGSEPPVDIPVRR